MGKNTGSEKRVGAIKNRVQTFNSKTGQYVKRDTTTGRFVSSKSTPYKGVRKDTNAKISLSSTKNQNEQSSKQKNIIKDKPITKNVGSRVKVVSKNKVDKLSIKKGKNNY